MIISKASFGTKYVISNTICKVVNPETMNLDKNPELVNSLDEKKTFVNPEPSDPSDKASEKISLS